GMVLDILFSISRIIWLFWDITCVFDVYTVCVIIVFIAKLSFVSQAGAQETSVKQNAMSITPKMRFILRITPKILLPPQETAVQTTNVLNQAS
ncbi:MAG: hypothetical protein RR234_04200, partial [Christensenella sp.]